MSDLGQSALDAHHTKIKVNHSEYDDDEEEYKIQIEILIGAIEKKIWIPFKKKETEAKYSRRDRSKVN